MGFVSARGGLPAVNGAEDDLGEVVATPRIRQRLDDLNGLDRQLYQYARRKSGRTGSTAIA